MPMPTWAWGVALLAACTGQTESANEGDKPQPEAEAAAEAPAEAPAPSAGPEAEMLAKGEVPPLGPNARMLEKVAEHYGVGLARCPLVGNGRVRQIYGTGRDQLTIYGPTWEMEWDAAQAPPWDPVFDEVLSEDHWVTLLAAPGQTRAWIATRTDVYEYTFPPAVAGQIVVCTGVHTTSPRVVRGRIQGDFPKEQDNLVVPCRQDTPLVASDNTFVVEIPTPCSMWVEGGPYRTEKVRVDEGTEPMDVVLTMQRDPLLRDNRLWSEKGMATVEETLAKVEARHKDTAALLDKLATTFADDAMIQSNVKRHRYEMSTRDHKIELTRIGLEELRRGKVPVLEAPGRSPFGH